MKKELTFVRINRSLKVLGIRTYESVNRRLELIEAVKDVRSKRTVKK